MFPLIHLRFYLALAYEIGKTLALFGQHKILREIRAVTDGPHVYLLRSFYLAANYSHSLHEVSYGGHILTKIILYIL